MGDFLLVRNLDVHEVAARLGLAGRACDVLVGAHQLGDLNYEPYS